MSTESATFNQIILPEQVCIADLTTEQLKDQLIKWRAGIIIDKLDIAPVNILAYLVLLTDLLLQEKN